MFAADEVWNAVHLDEQTLALTGDYSDELTKTVLPLLSPAKELSGWKYDQFLETAGQSPPAASSPTRTALPR